MSYVMKDRNGTYYLRIVLSDRIRQKLGQREYRRSLGTKSKREAYRRLPALYMQAMALIDDSRAPRTEPAKPRPPKHLLSVLLKKYADHQQLTGVLLQTINKTEYSVNLLIRLIGDKPVSAYTKQDARQFRDKALKLPKKGHQEETISITTFNNYTSNIISFFIWCEKEGYVEGNVFKGIKITQKRLQSSYRNAFTKEDIQKIFKHLENTPDIRADR